MPAAIPQQTPELMRAQIHGNVKAQLALCESVTRMKLTTPVGQRTTPIFRDYLAIHAGALASTVKAAERDDIPFDKSVIEAQFQAITDEMQKEVALESREAQAQRQLITLYIQQLARETVGTSPELDLEDVEPEEFEIPDSAAIHKRVRFVVSKWQSEEGKAKATSLREKLQNFVDSVKPRIIDGGKAVGGLFAKKASKLFERAAANQATDEEISKESSAPSGNAFAAHLAVMLQARQEAGMFVMDQIQQYNAENPGDPIPHDDAAFAVAAVEVMRDLEPTISEYEQKALAAMEGREEAVASAAATEAAETTATFAPEPSAPSGEEIPEAHEIQVAEPATAEDAGLTVADTSPVADMIDVDSVTQRTTETLTTIKTETIVQKDEASAAQQSSSASPSMTPPTSGGSA